MPAWLRMEGSKKLHAMPTTRNYCIGRNADCDLILDDPKVSRNHALIQHNGKDTYYIIDIASRNGCYVNTKRITAPSVLKNGDQIRIGDTHFEFVLEESKQLTLDPNETLVSTMNIAELDVQEITILVADIRRFTTLTESLPITELTMIMNRWFMDVTDCISDFNGVLDKFIGDSVYARWNTLDDPFEPVINALRSAIRLHAISEQMNKEFTEIPFPIKIGVGINTGTAALAIGTESTAMGDAVNLAFRLEDQSKTIGRNIVMSENSYQHLPDLEWDDRKMEIFVKGKSEAITIVGIDFPEAQAYLKRINKL